MSKNNDKKKTIVITYGTYDMLHVGHINILKRAKALGDYLIVGVTSEDYDRSRGKLDVYQNTQKRVRAIEKLGFVDEVIVERQKNQKAEDMVEYNVDIFAIGDDWVGKFDYLKEFTNVQYLPRTEGISSTELREEKLETISLGIIGLGRDTCRFLNEAKHVPAIMPTSIYDNDKKIVSKFMKKAPIKEGYDDFDAFLKGPIDAVFVDSSIDRHYNHISKSLKAGKHVLAEHPLALEKDELEELIALAKKHDRLLLSALKTAFLPAFCQLLEQLDDGVIGEIKEVRATFTSLYKEKHYPDTFLKQGATNTLLSYPALIVRKVLGERQSVTFFDQKKDGYDYSNRAITIHKNQTLGLSTVATGMKSEGAATISGTKGYVYIPAPWWLTKVFHFRFEDPNKSFTFQYEFEGCGLRYMISEFASLIQRGKTKSERLTMEDILDINDLIVEYNEYSKQNPDGVSST